MKIIQFIKSSNSKKYALLFSTGLVSTLAFAPFYLFPILFFSFATILKSIEKSETKKESFLIGWWFGFGFFISGTYWICNSLLVDPLKFAWLIPFTISVIPAVLAIYIGLATLFTYVLKNYKNIQNKFFIITIFASFWILFEYLRTILFSGFPWNLIGNIWCFSDIMIQIISLIGIYGLGFLTIILFSFLYLVLDRKNLIVYTIIYSSIFIIVFLFGFVRLKNAKVSFIPNIKMRLVQPSIKQDLKWDEDKIRHNLFEYILLSKAEGFDEITHLIWPESAIPFVLKEDSFLLKELNMFLGDKTLITGALRANFDDYNNITNIYNSVFVLKNTKILDYYDKSHLVPFGEYVPFRKFLPFISKITAGDMDFSKGTGVKNLKLNGDILFSPLICYEIIFPEKIMDYKNKPDFILNLTNDGWFGNSMGPYQHFDNAKLRAVENGISVIRVANNGISAIIDGYGRINQKFKLNKKGFLDFNISKKIKLIFYKKNKFILFILIVYILIISLKRDKN